ncbi:MarR family winged helix-turn-helix transcriptional regulator [Erwinia endophytica]|uniref:MarR family winged helix-turn-helix transcriptional regulator n=1 Tax=Erwinia endophytica TaxID=1563158 RepID=UPI00186B6520|nr:MarR family transcriptional regulator [Erwinia endophytica]
MPEMTRARKKQQMQVTVMMGLQHRSYRTCADQRLAHLGLSAALGWPLIMIGRHPEGVRHGKLSEDLGIESPSLLRPINQLINNGLVVRSDDPTDKRAKILRLTAEGQAINQRIETLLHDLRAELFADLSDDELTMLARLMERMGQRLAALRSGSLVG